MADRRLRMPVPGHFGRIVQLIALAAASPSSSASLALHLSSKYSPRDGATTDDEIYRNKLISELFVIWIEETYPFNHNKIIKIFIVARIYRKSAFQFSRTSDVASLKYWIIFSSWQLLLSNLAQSIKNNISLLKWQYRWRST